MNLYADIVALAESDGLVSLSWVDYYGKVHRNSVYMRWLYKLLKDVVGEFPIQDLINGLSAVNKYNIGFGEITPVGELPKQILLDLYNIINTNLTEAAIAIGCPPDAIISGKSARVLCETDNWVLYRLLPRNSDSVYAGALCIQFKLSGKIFIGRYKQSESVRLYEVSKDEISLELNESEIVFKMKFTPNWTPVCVGSRTFRI